MLFSVNYYTNPHGEYFVVIKTVHEKTKNKVFNAVITVYSVVTGCFPEYYHSPFNRLFINILKYEFICYFICTTAGIFVPAL